MAEHLKKPFKDSLSEIKDRMKEKRNRKWTTLGKISQISTVNCRRAKRATSSSVKMKSIQANNKALAQALQEEKLKLRDAQTTILHLRKEYQDLKFQMFDLQRNLMFKQAQGAVETRLSALSEIVSKVSQNLLESIDLLGPAKDLCSVGVKQRVLSSVLENNSSVIQRTSSVELQQRADGDDRALPRRMEAGCGRCEPAHCLPESCQELVSGFSLSKIIPDRGRTSDLHVDNIVSELENISSSGEDGFCNVLPKNVSTRRCHSKMTNQNKICTGVLSHLEAPDSTREPSKQDEIRLEERLDAHTAENIRLDIFQVDKVGSELMLRQMDSETGKFHSSNSSVPKQHVCKSREDSQVRREKDQKVKMGGTKNTSRPRSKKKQGKETPKEKLDLLYGSSDAYDFNFEESVHVTPFRQNKVNDADSDVDGKDSSETNTIESSENEEDLDDSLYVPYKSKQRRSSVDKMDTSPVHARPRSKRCLAQREQKLQKEETEKEAESNKSSDERINQPSKPSRGHLCDVTNTASSLPSTGNAPLVTEWERPPSPKRKRSCTLSVSYKEPSIAGKLRRGDPFTDVCFLNSPIFKQKKDAKRKSVRKESLSKYNEKFVGGC
ncbi:SGO1 protein, partial [Alectura lathami]|nr:SGO1 protein [Alectura lathami]